MDNYIDLARELENKLWNCGFALTPIVRYALGTTYKSLVKD